MFKTGAMSCACTPANTDIGKVRSWHKADVKTYSIGMLVMVPTY